MTLKHKSRLISIEVSVLLIFNASLIIRVPSVPILLSVHLSLSLYVCFLHSFFFLLHLRFSSVSVLFIFNDSLIILVPFVSILFSVYSIILPSFSPLISFFFICITSHIWSEFTINHQCSTYHSCSFCSNVVVCSSQSSYTSLLSLFLFFLSSQRFSSVSVPLIFNASLIIIAPSDLISLPVYLIYLITPLLIILFSFYHSPNVVKWVNN